MEKDLEDLRWSLRRKKTVEFLLSQAKIEDKGKSLIMTPDEARLVSQSQRNRGSGGNNLSSPASGDILEYRNFNNSDTD